MSVHSILLLDSLSFWFLLVGVCGVCVGAPLLVPMGWSILECLGEPGEAVSTCGDGMKRCTHTSDDKRGLSKRGTWAGGQLGS